MIIKKFQAKTEAEAVEIAKKEQTEKIKSQSHRELWNSGV